nr:MAG TPA: hypothetical protein [Caudoviricetes sp.]
MYNNTLKNKNAATCKSKKRRPFLFGRYKALSRRYYST